MHSASTIAPSGPAPIFSSTKIQDLSRPAITKPRLQIRAIQRIRALTRFFPAHRQESLSSRSFTQLALPSRALPIFRQLPLYPLLRLNFNLRPLIPAPPAQPS